MTEKEHGFFQTLTAVASSHDNVIHLYQTIEVKAIDSIVHTFAILSPRAEIYQSAIDQHPLAHLLRPRSIALYVPSEEQREVLSNVGQTMSQLFE